jgi:hypothetical protein
MEIHDLLSILKKRFEENVHRHSPFEWAKVEERLLNHSTQWTILAQMEETGGEPDVIQRDADTGAFFWVDCAKESPNKRRSLCFDHQARIGRKNYPPSDSAMEHAQSIGITLLTEEQYLYLQTLGDFDLKTSSWIQTPESLRQLGGALFGDKRYARTFIYHNGADSYYAARGYRGGIWI